jgi:hypothetical protein
MPFKPELTSLEGLHESVAKEYVKGSDGVYRLQVEKMNGWELANTAGLTSALEKERENGRKLKEYGDITPEAARTAVAKVVEFAKLDVDGKVKAGIELREAELLTKFNGEKKELETKITRYSQGLHRTLIEATADQAILEQGGNPHLLRHVVISQMRVKEDGERFVTEVFDPATGNARVGKVEGNTVHNLDVAGLVAELKKDTRYAPAFKAESKGGSGATGGSVGDGKTVDASKLSSVEKMRAARAASV